MMNTASPMANGASTGPRSAAAVTTTAMTAKPAASIRRCATPKRSPRFQASRRAEGHGEHQRQHQPAEGEIEEGLAPR